MLLVFYMKQLRLDNVNILVKEAINKCSDNVHMSNFQSLLYSNGKKILVRYGFNDSSKPFKIIHPFFCYYSCTTHLALYFKTFPSLFLFNLRIHRPMMLFKLEWLLQGSMFHFPSKSSTRSPWLTSNYAIEKKPLHLSNLKAHLCQKYQTTCRES